MTWLHDVREGGYRAGYTDGHQAGYTDGHQDGHAAGFSQGYNAGSTDATQQVEDRDQQLVTADTLRVILQEQLDAARRVAEEFRGNFRRGLCVGVFGGSLAATILASILVRIL